MVAFYHSMKCAEWKGDFHWDLTDYETWGGVTAALDTTKNEYRITAIEVPMAETYLPDGYSLPAELGKLSELRSLIVWGDGRAAGGIPSALSKCPLDMLYVVGEGFTRETLPEWIFQRSYLYPVIDETNVSSTNPNLFDDWENVDPIVIRYTKTGEYGEAYTSPWANGCSSSLSSSFRHEVRKEDLWSMIFHTFEENNKLGKTHYMCLYNAPSSMLKMFYRHTTSEGNRCNRPHCFSFAVKGETVQLLQSVEKTDVVWVFSNPLEGQAMPVGWEGFMVQIPRPEAVQVNIKYDLQLIKTL